MSRDKLRRLVKVVDTLLSKNGCRWDKKQNLHSLKGFVLEEALELIDALDRRDLFSIEEELGDILYHIVFISRLTRKKGSLDRAITGITNKLINRHPHIFKKKKLMKSGDVIKEWERLKIKEKNADSIGYGLLPTFTALLSAYKLGIRSESLNFDWEDLNQIFEKLNEEIEELKAEIERKRRDKRAIESEIGDILFVIANIARHLGINPEIALQKSNKKFISRFDKMYQLIKRENKDIIKLNISELEEYWQRAKRM